MASEKLPYSFKLFNNNTELLIEYIDYKYNTYKCLIDGKDVIVSNFLKGDMCRLKNMLECNPQFEVKIDSCLLTIHEPIFIQYSLPMVIQNKTSETDKINMLINEINTLKEEIKNIKYENKLQLNNTVNNCVIFGSFITNSKNSTIYMVNVNSSQVDLYYIRNKNNTIGLFDITPLKIMNNILKIDLQIHEKLLIKNENDCIYEPINHCKQLQELKINNALLTGGRSRMSQIISSPNNNIEHYNMHLYNLNFLKGLNNLSKIFIQNIIELNNIEIIYKLPQLVSVILDNCHNIRSLENKFQQKLKITISEHGVNAQQ